MALFILIAKSMPFIEQSVAVDKKYYFLMKYDVLSCLREK
jgi:hypothetical protein